MFKLNFIKPNKSKESEEKIKTTSKEKDKTNIVKKKIIKNKQEWQFTRNTRDYLVKNSKVIFDLETSSQHSSSLSVASGNYKEFLSYDHSLPRYKEISATCVKYNNELYILTSAHHSIKKAVTHPISQYTYLNFEPIYDFDIGATEMLLSYDEKDKQFINEVYPQGLGYGSDVWGFVCKYLNLSTFTVVTEYYSLETTTKGMIIYKLNDDSRVTSGKHYCYPIQFISGLTENTWGDVKTYDVTEMTINFKEKDAIKYIKRNTLIKFYIAKININSETVELEKPFEVSGKVLEILDTKDGVKSMEHNHSHMKMKMSDKMETTDDKMQETTDIKIRIKTDYKWKVGDHAHYIEVVTKDLINDKNKPYSLPKKIEAHMTVLEANRNVSCYFTKERAGRLLAIDLKPLLDNSKAKVTYDYFKDGEQSFTLDETSNKIIESGSLKGSHDVYVNEEQGVLYNLGMSITVKGKDDENTSLRTAICYDLKTNHLKPKPLSVIVDYPVNYLHDFVVESYDRYEQHILLGIPLDQTDELKYIGVGSTGDDYSVYDVTDINNVKKISALTIEGGGYYHQAWFTTDKKYLVTSDETQADNVKYINRVPILRLYYNSKSEKLELYHVQNIRNPFNAKNHNQYVVSNIDMFKYNNNEYEDWVFGANYSSGAQIQSLKYKEFNVNDFTNKFAYEIRNEPFTIEYIGFFDSEVATSDYSFEGVWSIYPFWEFDKPASKIKYVMSGDYQISYFQYKNGVVNYTVADLHNDGKVQKCHPTNILPVKTAYSEKYDEAFLDKGSKNTSRIDGVTELIGLMKKDGTKENVILTPVGFSDKLDVQIYYVSISDSNVNDFISLEISDSVENTEIIYGLCGNHICEGKVLKDMSTDHYRIEKGQSLDPNYYADYLGISSNNLTLYSSRVGEIITNLPARSGDSGNPVVNSKNQLIGFINSLDVTGGNTGLVNISRGIKNFLKPKDLPYKSTEYTGIEGIFNNRYNNIKKDDSKKLAVVAINPRNGKLYFYLSSTCSKYFMMSFKHSNYTPDERGTYQAIGKYTTSLMFEMNKKKYFSKSFQGSSFLRSYFIMKIQSKEKTNFLFAEELIGSYKNNGPRVVFLGYSNGKVYDKNYKEYDEKDKLYYYYIRAYLVGLSSKNINDLYSDNFNENPLGLYTGHKPRNKDIMQSDETKVKFIVVNSEVRTFSAKPSWIKGTSFKSYGSVYPFSDSVPSLFPYYTRGINSLQNNSDYVFNDTSKLKLTGFGENTIDQLNTSGLGMQIASTKTIENESRITLSEGWNSVSNNFLLPFELNLSILKINGQKVNSDNLEYLLLTIPYKEGKTIKLETDQGNFEVPLKRYKDNTVGII